MDPNAAQPPPQPPRPGPLAGQGPALAVIAVGGALGALGRYGIGLALPHQRGSFPTATFAINILGCLLIGVVIVVLTEWGDAPALARPFLATGILGGFTTFSTFATDAVELLAIGPSPTAIGYLIGTPAAAILATWSGVRLTRALGGLR